MAAGKSRPLAQRREQRRQDKAFSSVGEQSTKFHMNEPLQNTESSRFAPQWEHLIELGLELKGFREDGAEDSTSAGHLANALFALISVRCWSAGILGQGNRRYGKLMAV